MFTIVIGVNVTAFYWPKRSNFYFQGNLWAISFNCVPQTWYKIFCQSYIHKFWYRLDGMGVQKNAPKENSSNIYSMYPWGKTKWNSVYKNTWILQKQLSIQDAQICFSVVLDYEMFLDIQSPWWEGVGFPHTIHTLTLEKQYAE